MLIVRVRIKEMCLLGPLTAHEADEGRAPDVVGGSGGAQQSVEGGEALGRSGPPRRTSVMIASWPWAVFFMLVRGGLLAVFRLVGGGDTVGIDAP